MIATSIEQSKHLIELGVDPMTADMYYPPLNMDYPWVWSGKPLMYRGGIPAWSLIALLNLLPERAYKADDDDSDVVSLVIYPDGLRDARASVPLTDC